MSFSRESLRGDFVISIRHQNKMFFSLVGKYTSTLFWRTSQIWGLNMKDESEKETGMTEVRTNRGRCSFPRGKCPPPHPSPSTDECSQGCWLESTQHPICFDHQISDSTTDCRSHSMFAARVPPPPPLLICLACRFSSICSTLLDGMHLLMNGGGPLAPAAAVWEKVEAINVEPSCRLKLAWDYSPTDIPYHLENFFFLNASQENNKSDNHLHLYNISPSAIHKKSQPWTKRTKPHNPKNPAVTHFPEYCAQGCKNQSWTVLSLSCSELETLRQICSTWTIRADP